MSEQMRDGGAGTDPRAAACRAYFAVIKPQLKRDPPQTGNNTQRAKTDEPIVECLAVGGAHPQLRPTSRPARLLA
ncbi:hypothetical protein [Paracoccus shanxieyensis]|uniref:Uncharacterized protein n=1 Tax=Paracoccus shanxieyensis TaxID=2675752 RepID=A0A6L6IX22_9RHOB|nr:hypothetical protein [Paracoccus shanxieyensis]MTH63832.1 hypothetical protein [Paracoccus shanxieyensis]MTH86657.1 hypothetical protein [Paracoccus shanxieyensis]